jgi:dUTP pyrophosphatase
MSIYQDWMDHVPVTDDMELENFLCNENCDCGCECCCGETDGSVLISYKKLNDLATEPTRGSEDAAGYDLYAAIDTKVVIPPHQKMKIGTGLAFELPKHTFAGIFARSGLANKQGLRPANCVGVCDSDYRGEYMVVIHNDSEYTQTIEPGMRIGQMVLLPYIPMKFKEVEELSETGRGEGGFGSTGK